MKNIYWAILLVSLISACGQATKKSELLTLDQVPQNLMDIAKEKLPDVTFERAVRKPNGVLEVTGKDKKGKVRDIEFSKTGEVVEIE
jgi:hypothetical protein